MTQKANPSVNRPAEAFKTAGAIAYGGSDEGFISASNSPTEISVQDDDINEAQLNAFDQTSSGSSLDVTIDGGEAFVFGSWLAIDTQTSVSLAANTSAQTVSVGWNKNGADDVIIGLDAAFSSKSGDADQKIPLFSFDTDSSGVTNVADERSFDQISVDTIEQGSGSGLDADTVDGVEASDLGANAGDNLSKSGNTLDVVDGSGSGLDADTVDGLEASEIEFTDERAQDAIASIIGANLNYDDANNTLTIVQGSGSGLDADTVDGIEGSELGSDVSNNGVTVTNSSTDLNFTNNITAIDDGDGTSTISVDSTAEKVDGPDGNAHFAGSLPRFSDTAAGLSNTSEGDMFYSNTDKSVFLNDGT